jgi:transcriptional regulator with GAF, ATPase, and Fis domain
MSVLCMRDTQQASAWRGPLVGKSPAIEEIVETIRLVGPRRTTVLIQGESGTGKELVARALHAASPRSHLPMVSVNCGALPEDLLEAELFGHVRGAFTGAVQQRAGRFEQAHRSTLFLDEVGDLPLNTQVKLLRALQEREFQRLGSSETVKVDVRIIAATNADLGARVEDGSFREDLYYRLNVLPIQVPALRQRLEDIPVLVEHFLDKICRHEGVRAKTALPETLDHLMDYEWPGNIRHLENAVEKAIVLSGEREALHPDDFRLPSSASRPCRLPDNLVPFVALPDEGLDFERTVGRLERALLQQALEKARGNKKRAAEMLRLKRTTLAAKLKSAAVG